MARSFVASEILLTHLEQVRQPSFLAWNRLEWQPFSDDITRSLTSEVRDPLWMLARQWQTGEFMGEDAGSPLTARVAFRADPLQAVGREGAETPFDATVPLEAAVEAEPLPDDLLLNLRIGRLWFTTLERVGLGATTAWFRDRFPPPPDPDEGKLSGLLQAADADLQLWRKAAHHVGGIAGLALATHLRAWLAGATADAPGGLTPEALDKLRMAGAAFLASLDALFVRPPTAETWDRSRFEYRFAIRTEESERLVADQHDGTRLDWPSFDLEPLPPPPAAAPVPWTTRAFLPQPVAFPGMPSNRWWEFEDRRIDLGAIAASRTDLAKMLFIQFGLLYGNDWFILPLDAQIGSLVRVAGIVVNDCFGDATFVPPDDQLLGNDRTLDASTLFTLSDPAGRLPNESILFVPPATVAEFIGEPFDRVALLRDEMTNMAWAIELTVPSGRGGGKDARAAAAATAGRLSPAQVSDAPLHAHDSTAPPGSPPLRYRLATHTPENWIPLVPVRRVDRNDQIDFQQGALLRDTEKFRGTKILPQGGLLARHADEFPLFIHEEEVPRSGATVTRAFSRVRWLDGRTAVWLGREKRNGQGEGASGLAFDDLVAQRPGEGAVT